MLAQVEITGSRGLLFVCVIFSHAAPHPPAPLASETPNSNDAFAGISTSIHPELINAHPLCFQTPFLRRFVVPRSFPTFRFPLLYCPSLLPLCLPHRRFNSSDGPTPAMLLRHFTHPLTTSGSQNEKGTRLCPVVLLVFPDSLGVKFQRTLSRSI